MEWGHTHQILWSSQASSDSEHLVVAAPRLNSASATSQNSGLSCCLLLVQTWQADLVSSHDVQKWFCLSRPNAEDSHWRPLLDCHRSLWPRYLACDLRVSGSGFSPAFVPDWLCPELVPFWCIWNYDSCWANDSRSCWSSSNRSRSILESFPPASRSVCRLGLKMPESLRKWPCGSLFHLIGNHNLAAVLKFTVCSCQLGLSRVYQDFQKWIGRILWNSLWGFVP